LGQKQRPRGGGQAARGGHPNPSPPHPVPFSTLYSLGYWWWALGSALEEKERAEDLRPVGKKERAVSFWQTLCMTLLRVIAWTC
jgi:hypothetical protein